MTVAMEGDNKAIVFIGEQDFPFPIPLVRKNVRWQFDTAAGREEFLYRRIGRNELDAVEACLAYADAQNEYAGKDRTGAGVGVYAQHIVSRPGKKDGLYWPASQGEEESPLGELVAAAAEEGYLIGGRRAPFHGYYFKVLTKQGPNAPGGTLDYVVNGKMIIGFALVAYQITVLEEFYPGEALNCWRYSRPCFLRANSWTCGPFRSLAVRPTPITLATPSGLSPSCTRRTARSRNASKVA